MSRTVRVFILFGLVLVVLGNVTSGQADSVNESARHIPVAYQTDVVVVGGGTTAVAAASAAAESGARVFLAAPLPYLGDDMTGTLRLWLEEGEEPVTPLARKIFHDPARTGDEELPWFPAFSYRASRPSAQTHPDTDPPSRLRNGRWRDPVTQSVQYNGNVSIDIDLGKNVPLHGVRVFAFLRMGKTAQNGFGVNRIELAAAKDDSRRNRGWLEKIASANDWQGTGNPTPHGQPIKFLLAVPPGTEARFLRLDITKSPGAKRILLGEIEILGSRPGQDANKDNTSRPLMPRPMHVKKTLDDALLDAEVSFLYSCYATDVLRDDDGRVCGIVMANRAGRQAVIAKVVIDATENGAVARLAGAEFRRPTETKMPKKKTRVFRRTVIGGEPVEGTGLSHRVIMPPFYAKRQGSVTMSGDMFKVIEYTLQLPLAGNMFDGQDYGNNLFAAMAAADQAARRMTYHPQQQFTSDILFHVPDNQIVAQKAFTGNWSDVAAIPLDAFRPKGMSRLFVAGPTSDVTRPVAERLVRPLARIDLGMRVGCEAAAEAKALPAPRGAHLPGKRAVATAKGDVAEVLRGVRPTQELQTIKQQARSLPVLGHYDVVVIGGGTAGAPAGIAAARAGAKTLVVEYLHGLGGVGTMGAISKYYHGNRVGFTKTVGGGADWQIEQKMEWYRRELEKAGADVWFGVIGCGAFVEQTEGNKYVRGAIVATPHGRGVVLAKVVIDATGNADVATAAGAACQYVDGNELAMQGTGLPPRRLGSSYTNTDFTYSDETDMVDVWRMFLHGKDKYPDAFDQGQLIDTRERRRIVGEATVTILDQINRRTYPDSIVQTQSDFDSHGYTIDPYFLFEHPKRTRIHTYVPYRCLLPRGIKGMLVTGIGISVHRDALPAVRMQPDVQNQGYAAGHAAALAAAVNVDPSKIDIKKLQRHLVKIGNLPKSVLTDEDSWPLSREQIAQAIEGIRQGRPGAAVILTHREAALPLLRKAYQKAKRDGHSSQLDYAKYLCVLDGGQAVDTIIDTVKRHRQWDRGWNFRGLGQYGNTASPLDTLIMILGHSSEQRAVPCILEKLELLTAKDAFSHHRAVGLALEQIGDARAAKPLAQLLSKPGMRGYAHTSIERVRQLDSTKDVGMGAIVSRCVSLRELALARALYRCGDYHGLGREILMQYTHDLRGHFARHAKAVLKNSRRTAKKKPTAKIQVYNCGVPGMTSRQALARLPRVLAKKPDHLIIFFGINDALNSKKLVTAKEFSKNLETMAARAKKAGVKSVLVLTIHPVIPDYLVERHPTHPQRNRLQNHLDSYNAAVRQAAKKADMILVDWRARFLEKSPGDSVQEAVTNQKQCLLRCVANCGRRDGSHLTPEGYHLLAETVAWVLQDRIEVADTVVCYGDSITFGSHMKGQGTSTGNTYPAVLLSLLRNTADSSESQ